MPPDYYDRVMCTEVIEHATTPGDLLAVAATGAYCRSMASTYNHVPRPPVVAVAPTGTTAVLLRRETEDDLLALDPG